MHRILSEKCWLNLSFKLAIVYSFRSTYSTFMEEPLHKTDDKC